MDQENLTVNPCPLCKKSHKYVLNVDREYAMGLVISGAHKEITRQFDVVLTCPKKNVSFVVTVSLCETDLSRIKSVKERRHDDGS